MNKQNKTEIDSQIQRTNGCQRGNKWGNEWNRWGRLRGTNFQLQNKCHWDEIYAVGNIVPDNVVSLYGDKGSQKVDISNYKINK